MRRCIAIILLAAGCSSAGQYVWVDEYNFGSGAPEEFVLGPGDLVDVRVFHEDAMSGKARVRNDGMISLPFLGDVRAGGVAPARLAREIETRLKEFIRNPVVTVSLEERQAANIPVLGEVAHPGIYPLADAGLVQALAAAGGLTQFASKDRIFVLRPNPTAARVRFRFEDIARGKGAAAMFRLRAGDSVVVE